MRRQEYTYFSMGCKEGNANSPQLQYFVTESQGLSARSCSEPQSLGSGPELSQTLTEFKLISLVFCEE